MTEERKREQKPWYPTIERMPEIRDVETRRNRSSGDVMKQGIDEAYGVRKLSSVAER